MVWTDKYPQKSFTIKSYTFILLVECIRTKLRLSIDGEHWSDPFEIDIELPPPPSPFPTSKKNDANSPTREYEEKHIIKC